MSPECHVVTETELNEWYRYYDQLNEPGPYHNPEYLTLLAGNFEHQDERPEAFVLEYDGEIAYYPYIRRSLETVQFADQSNFGLSKYDDIVSSWYYGGPITSAPENTDLATTFKQEFTEYCKQTEIVAEFIRFDPNERNHEQFDCLEPIFNRETVPVDLSGSEKDIWDGYEGRNQRAIKQGKETDITVEVTNADADISAFHEIYSNAMEARDAAEHYRFTEEFFQNLIDHSELATLLVARYHGEVIGGFIIVHDETVGHHYLSASNPDYWDKRVNNLMYHEVVMHMHETGRELFDFQGGRPGVFKFKKGFSPERGKFYIGKRIHLSEIYEEIVTEAKKHGIDTETGYFPAYRFEQSN